MWIKVIWLLYWTWCLAELRDKSRHAWSICGMRENSRNAGQSRKMRDRWQPYSKPCSIKNLNRLVIGRTYRATHQTYSGEVVPGRSFSKCVDVIVKHLLDDVKPVLEQHSSYHFIDTLFEDLIDAICLRYRFYYEFQWTQLSSVFVNGFLVSLSSTNTEHFTDNIITNNRFRQCLLKIHM